MDDNEVVMIMLDKMILFSASASILVLLFGISPLPASEIRVLGDKDIGYSIECNNDVGNKFIFSGKSPHVHILGTTRLPTRCQVDKTSPRGLLQVFFDFESINGSELITVAKDSETKILLPGEMHSKTLNFKYSMASTSNNNSSLRQFDDPLAAPNHTREVYEQLGHEAYGSRNINH